MQDVSAGFTKNMSSDQNDFGFVAFRLSASADHQLWFGFDTASVAFCSGVASVWYFDCHSL